MTPKSRSRTTLVEQEELACKSYFEYAKYTTNPPTVTTSTAQCSAHVLLTFYILR